MGARLHLVAELVKDLATNFPFLMALYSKSIPPTEKGGKKKNESLLLPFSGILICFLDELNFRQKNLSHSFCLCLTWS